MNKTLITTLLAAALGAPLVAGAQVSLGGKIGVWAERATGGTTALAMEPTSNFALSAGERVAGGLTVRAALETSLRGNTFGGTDTRLGDRQATLGVVHTLGSVDAGRGVHSHFLTVSGGDAFATGPGSVAGVLHPLRGLRMSDALFAATTVGGVSVGVDGVIGGDARALSAATTLRGVGLGVAHWRDGADRSTVFNAKTKIAGVGLSWLHSVDDTGATRSTGDSIGALYKVGTVTFKGTLGRATGVRALAVGADVELSKRTVAGVALNRVDRQIAADTTTVTAGLTHRF